MVNINRITENKKFNKWYAENGYKYKPKTLEEGDWLNVVRYWAWKAWEAAISQK